jgi:hypothetical protein
MKYQLNYSKVADYISAQLTYICNDLPAVHIFGEHLKYSNIKPLNKNGEKPCIFNYRTIPLLCSLTYLRVMCKRTTIYTGISLQIVLFQKSLSPEKALLIFPE